MGVGTPAIAAGRLRGEQKHKPQGTKIAAQTVSV
jgi:hypothetical protein